MAIIEIERSRIITRGSDDDVFVAVIFYVDKGDICSCGRKASCDLILRECSGAVIHIFVELVTVRVCGDEVDVTIAIDIASRCTQEVIGSFTDDTTTEGTASIICIEIMSFHRGAIKRDVIKVAIAIKISKNDLLRVLRFRSGARERVGGSQCFSD
jgi:hypothetical protein